VIRWVVMMALAYPALGLAAELERVALSVENLTCPACSLTIKTALKREPGVSKTEVDASTHTVNVSFDPQRTSVARIVRIVTDAGFPAHERSNDR
jgi:mercuric ion binding protein